MTSERTVSTDEVVKHTPGPWTYRDEANREEVWIGVPGRSIGMMVIATVQYGFTPPANLEQQANARLIAAAPDMLLKLRELAAECVECSGTGKEIRYLSGIQHEVSCRECDDIRKVIAKAEGRS